MFSIFWYLFKYLFFLIRNLSRWYKGFLPTPCSHACIVSPVTNILQQSSTFVTNEELTWTHHYHPKAIVSIRVHSWCCTFYGFGPVFLPGESPWREEPGGLQSKGSQRVRHDWVTKHIGTYGFPEWLCVKNLPAMHETQVPTLGQECPLEKEMATHSCILAWKIPWTEKLGKL